MDEVYCKIVEMEDLIEEDRLSKAMSSANDKLLNFHEEKLLSMDALKGGLCVLYFINLLVLISLFI